MTMEQVVPSIVVFLVLLTIAFVIQMILTPARLEHETNQVNRARVLAARARLVRARTARDEAITDGRRAVAAARRAKPSMVWEIATQAGSQRIEMRNLTTSQFGHAISRLSAAHIQVTDAKVLRSGPEDDLAPRVEKGVDG